MALCHHLANGALVSLADVAINFGILLGYATDGIVDAAVASNNPSMRWRVAIGLSAGFPLAFVMCYPLLPETPRWLVMTGREVEAAEALRRLEPGLSDQGIEVATDNIRASLSDAAPRGESWLSAMGVGPDATKATRRRVAIALSLAAVQQLVGSEAILYYSPTILRQCGPTLRAINSSQEGCSKAEVVFGVSLALGVVKFAGELNIARE